ncbi:hypothetical protein [Paraflavitalea pollutisoli]|uniref:hypothetical protein n=1 Tax=Paraflavitalea pollutisoli TaxID=3034143 RepID=UPI0023EDC5C0|nr:hypothetical protein [Paraflavitalea sp. H1-2-19X]
MMTIKKTIVCFVGCSALLAFGGCASSDSAKVAPAPVAVVAGQTFPVHDLAAAEQLLIRQYDNLANDKAIDPDSLGYPAGVFRQWMDSLTSSNAASITYPFNRLQDSAQVSIVTAADGQFRIYSWDNWTGGTMHNFDAVYQWKGNDGVHATKPVPDGEGDPGGWTSRIYTVTINDKPHYLAVSHGVYSTSLRGQLVKAFTIDEGKLIDTVQVFKTRSGRLNSIDVSYDMTQYDEQRGDDQQLIVYDSLKQVLYIPVVQEGGILTTKNLVYALKAECLQYVGVEEARRGVDSMVRP